MRQTLSQAKEHKKLEKELKNKIEEVQYREKRLEHDKKAYEEAVAIKPDFFDALYNLGVMYYNKGGDMIKEANIGIGISGKYSKC